MLCVVGSSGKSSHGSLGGYQIEIYIRADLQLISLAFERTCLRERVVYSCVRKLVTL